MLAVELVHVWITQLREREVADDDVAGGETNPAATALWFGVNGNFVLAVCVGRNNLSEGSVHMMLGGLRVSCNGHVTDPSFFNSCLPSGTVILLHCTTLQKSRAVLLPDTALPDGKFNALARVNRSVGWLTIQRHERAVGR